MREKPKLKFTISCGICGRKLAETDDPRITIMQLAKAKKLKKVRIEFYNSEELNLIEEFYICNKCLRKLNKFVSYPFVKIKI
ncbi:MAG: hypothetical protein C0172_02830 [Caldisphaera sp.]|nr:MAG: hypothetical protein C0172_02830 [Caldisphaera sp.]